MTAYGSLDLTIEAIKLGAYYYLENLIRRISCVRW